MTVRKAEILSAAKEVFAEQGVKRTTVRQIGARAGILSGSLYHHFESKLDLVDGILSEFCDEVLEEYRRMAASTDDAPSRFRTMMRYAFSLLDRHSAAVAIIQQDSTELVKDPRFGYLVSFNQEIEDHWTDTVRDGIRQGAFRRSVDARLFYRFTRDAILGARRWYTPSKPKTFEDLADEFADILLLGITEPSDGPAQRTTRSGGITSPRRVAVDPRLGG
jgi:TetR/AcrR family transcriptional regulator, cholesterol catabolism regulator